MKKIKDIIYVCGHQHPDTDSIVSALAYAYLKQRLGTNALACRLGDINDETRYVLDRFKVSPPILLKNARASLEEIEMDDAHAISIDTSIRDAMDIMTKNKKQALAVVNNKNQLLGVITNSNLAYVAIGDTSRTIELLKRTSVESIAKSIEGRIVFAPLDFKFNGKVSIVAIAATKLENYELQERLVIIGNDAESQIDAINMGAACIVTVWTNSIAPHVIELAKEKGCAIIMSSHGTLNTSRYLFFSPSVKEVMTTDLVYFNKSEYVDDVGKRMLKTRFRAYPVVDDQNRIYGFVSRYHILNSKNKKIIMVDHNEYSQSVEGIENADVLEVIDHHRIGDVNTLKPIYFRNEIIGSTASIVVKMFKEANVEIPKKYAALLLAAIISDTLNLKSPTTTDEDRAIVQQLESVSELTCETFAKEMFDITSSLNSKSYEDIINQDLKSFTISGKEVLVSQIVVYQLNEVNSIYDKFRTEMERFTQENRVDLLVVVITSVIDNGSIIFGAGPLKEAVTEAFPLEGDEKYTMYTDIVSRKNQIIPRLSVAIAQLVD